MTVLLNGEFVPEESAQVSVFDRGFTYGDGVFEAVRVSNGRLFRWTQHLERLKHAAAFSKIPLPPCAESLHESMQELIARNSLTTGMVRIQLTRGAGPRGYAPAGTEKPTLVATAHLLPPAGRAPVKLIVSSLRVPAGSVLTQNKTTSRLLNVLAAIEARDSGADDALLLDTNGHVTEAVASNLFWIKDGTVFTAPVAAGLLPGITRDIVFELCRELRLPAEEQLATPEIVAASDGIFLSMSSLGIVRMGSIDGRELPQPALVAQIAAAYDKLLAHECR